MLKIWLLTSTLILTIFAPFFLSTGLFISAQMASIFAVIGAMINLNTSCSMGGWRCAQLPYCTAPQQPAHGTHWMCCGGCAMLW